MDSRQLMKQAVDLNIKLMRWRMWPDLDTNKIANTRCLLLGAGTLGCAVARGLLGWGVKNITFVDNGRVSYSNPARQCLFEYQHAVDQRFKAEIAAEVLQKIFPETNSQSFVSSIPMPNHSLQETNEEEGNKQILLIDELIQSHDVIFALTDSREARYDNIILILPTNNF